MKYIRLIFLAALCLTYDLAHGETIEAQKHACVADFMKLCKGHPNILQPIASYGDLHTCIKEHRSEISPRCLRVLSEYGL